MGVGSVELQQPATLEIDGIHQDQAGVSIQPTCRDQFPDLLLGPVFDPLVNDRACTIGIATEIDAVQGAVIVSGHYLRGSQTVAAHLPVPKASSL